MQKMRKWVAVLALFAGLSAFGAYTTHEVGQGAAVDLAATGNTANDIYICQGGNTFTLTGTAAADGSFAVKAAIRTPNNVDGATLTFDASGVTGCTSLRWTGHIWTTGAVTVKGGGAHAAEGAFAYDAATKTVFYKVPKAGSVILLR